MTAELLMRAMRRRWYVGVTCVAILVWLVSLTGQIGRTYWAQAEVLFVEPGGASVGNVNDGAAGSLIEFAGLVARKVSMESGASQLSSTNVTLYGSGIRDGYSVAVADTGTQWAPSYSQPKISIQATGGSPEDVSQTIMKVVAQIKQTAIDLQRAAGAPPESFIQLDISPEPPPSVVDVGSTRSGRLKGLVAFSGIGVALAGYAAWTTDQIVSRRLSRRLSRVCAS